MSQKCHACRGICTLSLVTTSRSPDNAIRKNTQHDTSKALHLPREMTMEVAKVLRLPRKLELRSACHTFGTKLSKLTVENHETKLMFGRLLEAESVKSKQCKTNFMWLSHQNQIPSMNNCINFGNDSR
jgi:hypothetical protein